MNEKDRRNPQLRGALREGAVAFLPVAWLLLPVLSQVGVTFLVAAPVWFLGRCVFLDDWRAVGGECLWLPELGGGEWRGLISTVSTLTQARRMVERLDGLLISDWKRIDKTMDWNYVPPMPLEEGASAM